MVGIVNPSKNKTLSDYKERASELSKAVTPGRTMYGGKLVDSDDADSNDDDGDDDDSDDSSKSKDGDDDSAAQFLQVPVFGLIGVIGLAYAMV